MDPNMVSKTVEGEDIKEYKSESNTQNFGEVETTDLHINGHPLSKIGEVPTQPVEGDSPQCLAFEQTEYSGKHFERGEPLTKNEEDCDVDEEETNKFEVMLKQVKETIRNEKDKEINVNDWIAISILQKYRFACEKYEVFPLKECFQNLHKDIINLSNLNMGPLSFKPVVESLILSRYLTQLILPNNRLGIDGLKWISYLFTITGRISHLNLANNFIGPRGAEFIENILNNGFYLESLDLSSNGLRDAQLIGITQILSNNCFNLKELNVSDNDFRSESGKSLGQCLSSNEGLEMLDLSFNKLRGGAADIFHGLQSNCFLKILDLSSNEIGEECASELGNFLAVNKCLEELNLRHNLFTADSVIVMRKNFKRNQTLRFLCLGCNPLFSQGALFLLSAVSSRKSEIEYLDLTGIRVDQRFLKMWDRAIDLGRNLDVRHGHRLDCYTCEEEDEFDVSSMAHMITLANSHGVSLKSFLREIYTKFLFRQHNREAEAEEPTHQSITKTVSTEQEQVKNDIERYPRIKIRKFVEILKNSPLNVPEGFAQDFAQDFADDRGTVNIGDIIIKIPLQYDEFEDED